LIGRFFQDKLTPPRHRTMARFAAMHQPISTCCYDSALTDDFERLNTPLGMIRLWTSPIALQ
ncbi:MAG TPA: hypothetical protein VL418_16250, partial [Devosiaceae bacterium]|nr:hypothetical protein [Devosiaceae bacterium]